MNAKISAMHDQHSKLQARRIQAKKDLISLKNDIASKEEFAKLQQKKYDAMKLELEQRGRQIKEMEEEVHEYEKLGPQAATLNSHDIMIEKFLAEPNVKKELNQLLHEENRKVDTKFVIGKISSTVDEEGEVPPHAETYAKSMVEAVTIKFIRKRREDKKGQKEMEDDDSKKMSFIAQFRINKDTTFVQLKLAACNFWETHKQGCSYFLTDEAGAQLPEGCKIEEYFKSQLQDIHNILLILKPQEPSKNLNAGMIEAISNRDQQTQGQVGQLNFTRTKKVEVDGYGEFFDNFPGMKNFINEDKLKEKKKSKFVSDEDKRTRFIDDNHCCVAFFIFLIMLISVIAVPLDRKVTYDYNLWSSINQLLLIGDAFASDSKSYNNVLSMQNTMDYLTNVMVPNLFLTTLPPVDVLSPAIFQQNVYIGPLRIRQVRTKQMPSCVSIPASTQEIYCYYDSYDKDTRDTTTFGDGSQSWQIFHTAEENGISSKMSSTTSSYDGSGYVIDFDMTATNSSMAISTLNSTYNDGFLDFGTRAIFVDANLYNPTLNRLIQISLGFEFTIGGYVIPLANEISIYRQIRYVTEHLHVRYEIVQGMCAVLLLIFLIYMTATDEQGRRKFNWQYWTTFPAASTLILIIVVFMGINSNKTMRDFNIDLNSLINTKTFFDSKDLANAYWYSLFYETLGVFVASVRIMYFFRLSPNFVLIVNTISKAGRIFIQYIITLAPILVSFAVIGMLLWGTISQDFNIRGNAFISVMALALGHFDSQILADADIYLTAVLLTLYYFFLVFFLITVFTSLTIDMYRVTKMEHSAEEGGKPKDFKLFAWLFGWVPSKRIMQVVEFFKKRFGKKDEAKDKKGGKEGSKEGDKEPIITKENKDTVIDSARKEKLIEMKRAI